MAELPVEQPNRPRVYSRLPEKFSARANDPRDRVLVELLTDPWSVWCWGFEPVRRTLDLRYPTIEFKFLLGGMFESVPKPDEAGFDVDRFFQQVQRTTGMPINATWLKDDPPDSTYPACVHAHAARLVAPEKERAFLRALREAAYLDGRNISSRKVAEEVARRVGIDVALFGEHLDSGEAEQEFRDRLQRLEALRLGMYPTLLVTSAGKTARIEGFQPLPAVLAVIEAVTGRWHPPRPDPPLETILAPGERVATREVAEVLGVSVERAYDKLREAEEKNAVTRLRVPSGDAWSRKE